MPRRKSLILFTMVAAIVALLFAASQAGAFSVEVVPCNDNGELKFPCYDAETDTTEFRYQITANKKVEYFDLLIPTACPQGEDPPKILYSTPGGKLYTDGKGSKKKFGRGLSSHDVYSVTYYKKNGTVSLFAAGNRTAETNDMALVMSSDHRKWALMQDLLPGCGAPDRTQTGAVSTAECLDVFVPVGGIETRLVSYSVQRGPNGCDVDDINQVSFFASESCAGTALARTVPIPPPPPPPGDEDGEHQSFCGSLRADCPECVDVRLSCSGNYCVEYTTNSGAKVQQCIDAPGGTACQWVEDGCEEVFDDTIVGDPCADDLG